MLSEGGIMLTLGIAFLIVTVGMWRLLRCRHAWELVDKTEFAPTIEDYAKNGANRFHLYSLSSEAVERMSKRTVVLVIRCTKCGASKLI